MTESSLLRRAPLSLSLGGMASTTSLTLRVSAHLPIPPPGQTFCMVGREGFEPPKAKPKDLQSSPFDHSGTDPYTKMEPLIRLELMTVGLQNRCSTN